MRHLRTLSICLMLGLGPSCSLPASNPPELDKAMVREEVTVQKDLVHSTLLISGQPSRKRETSITTDRMQLARLAELGWRVVHGAAGLCGSDLAPATGAIFATIYDVPGHLRAGYSTGRDGDVMVMAVARGSPADLAGLVPGDVVMAIDGSTVKGSGSAAREVEAALDRPRTLTLGRAATQITAEIVPAPACRSRLDLARTRGINAFADGAMIAVTAGLMDLIDDDDQLAAIIGHELAHNILGHRRMREENRRKGAMVGEVLAMLTGARDLESHWARVGGGAFSQMFETEADYVGLYFVAAAGFNVRSAPVVWRRMVLANPATIAHAGTHPTSPERFVLLARTVEEILAKQDRGAPLTPERKR